MKRKTITSAALARAFDKGKSVREIARENNLTERFVETRLAIHRQARERDLRHANIALHNAIRALRKVGPSLRR